MPEPTQPGSLPDPERDEEPLGLSLSELLGEVWAPVGRRPGADDDLLAASGGSDPDSGDAAPWNL
jgi:hypothetical protein